MQWIEVSIVCERVATDEVTTLFDDYADNGIIEEDVENHPNLIKLTMYADPSLDIDRIKSDLENRLTEANISVTSINANILDESTWLNSWQQYIEPTEILPNLIIKPAWQEYENIDNKTIIEIDSDISFGTGSHETTKTCAELLKSYSESMDLNTVTCLDIGTGTGILLLVAAYLGVKNLVGIDIEEYAANQARINCENNHVSAEIICGNLDSDFNGTAQIILANLTVDPLKILLPQIGNKLVDKGILIISGIIDDRYDEIMPYIKANWHIIEERIAGPWHTFALEKR
ncbi:MAG: 50S ribosomal protein L11 methyltransferase [Veillonella sp.]|uniref:50S ribosomal protein L11 methyltransferase n=1 Tax=Veillonella sp. TaxID=1926307 RepID=UPI001D5C9119|nr:50S ribosomal protein L11 methyltransferase [Veillonella sp.]MBS7013826.1 50S ribosomal protein L11 methyltransferase [Veillonella sp.]